MLRSGLHVILWLSLLVAVTACADPCLDDGLFQGAPVDCQAVPGSTSGSTGTAENCFNGVQDSDETAVDCGGICEAACKIGEGCVEAEDCETSLCGEDLTCRAPASCDDGAKDDGESDQDCGGVCGSTCPIDAECDRFVDCESLVCGPDDGLCAAPTCTDGAPNGSETDVDCGGPVCEPCGTGGGCIQDTDCLTGTCDDQGICVAPHCANGELDAEETDVDCGGPDCAPCAGGEECLQDEDCVSAVCDDGTCTTASCDDGVRNGDETDVDCGGAVCDACVDGQGCELDGDCASESCDPVHEVCEAASCSNGILDGTETDIDCGGPSCAPCDDGESCEDGSDCTSNSCTGATCEPASCDDGVRNGTESDLDCGGDTCDPCDDGEMCVLQSDCTSMVCLLEECQPPACNDGVQNGTETDVDCGGDACSGCDTDETCNEDDDCASRVCDDGTNTCTAPTCEDGVTNGDESDTDCGGDTCDPCGDGETCNAATDCASMVCLADACQLSACDDGVLNGDETDIDCGGSCQPCDDGETCDLAADCESLVCDATTDTCTPATCSDGVQNQGEADVDCGGDTCSPCNDGEGCGAASDCVSGVCDAVTDTCSAPTCSDGVANGDETDTDCGGTCGATCETGEGCDDVSDCAEGACDGTTDTCSAPTCNDGVTNGNETDVDCGGDTCSPCDDGESCNVASDCDSGICDVASQACTVPTCADGIANGDETDVDCGGSCGATCDTGDGCDDGSDCSSAGCDGGACNAPLSVVITPNACGDAAGGVVSYTAVASGGTGGPYTYQWTPDDGTVDAPTSASVNIHPPDYASYTVTADDGADTDTAVGVVVLSNQAFNLQSNCTLYQGTFLPGTPLASISYSAGGTVATEAGNNDLGLHLCEGVAFANTRLSGSFAVNTTGDDDFAGFVWGAQDNSHFYILSWKQAAQNFFNCSGGNSPQGITIKRVFAPDFASMTGSDLYCPNDTANSEYLMTPAETLATGWADNTSYTIEIDFTSNSGSTVRVTNDATATLLATFDVTDTTYQDGFFGSHTISQQAVSVGPLVGSCL